MTNDYPGPERRGRKPLSARQAADLLGFSEQTITRYLRDGLLPGWRVRKTWKIDAVVFREIFALMRKGINPFVQQRSPYLPSTDESANDASAVVDARDGNYPGPERRGRRPITLEWASRVLKRTPEEVLAFADRFPMCAYKNQQGEWVFPPSRFRAFYPQLVNPS